MLPKMPLTQRLPQQAYAVSVSLYNSLKNYFLSVRFHKLLPSLPSDRIHLSNQKESLPGNLNWRIRLPRPWASFILLLTSISGKQTYRRKGGDSCPLSVGQFARALKHWILLLHPQLSLHNYRPWRGQLIASPGKSLMTVVNQHERDNCPLYPAQGFQSFDNIVSFLDSMGSSDLSI